MNWKRTPLSQIFSVGSGAVVHSVAPTLSAGVNMNKRNVVRSAIAITAIGAASAGVAMANASGPDVSVESHPDVVDAALTFTGGGAANSVELDEENGATWEVEVATPDAGVVDVRLDENLDLVVIEGDNEAS
jgi:hypothetical protein